MKSGDSMGIYIKGIEMPTRNHEIIIRIQSDGRVLDQWGHRLNLEPTAIPVPPHGDLIERQAVLETFSIHMNRGLHFVTIRDTIPTIIPAEEQELWEGRK